jgi:hypothetical protein
MTTGYEWARREKTRQLSEEMMALKAWGNKRDESEPEIVAALREAGCFVQLLDRPCDLLVGFRGRTHLVECKTGKGKVTDDQRAFRDAWRGSPVETVRTPDEAIELVRRWACHDR